MVVTLAEKQPRPCLNAAVPTSLVPHRSLLTICLVLACSPAETGSVASAPISVSLTSVPGADDRVYYVISGNRFNDRHLAVGDLVWRVGSAADQAERSAPPTRPIVDEEGWLQPDFEQPAPFVMARPVFIMADLAWFEAEPAPDALEVTVAARLWSSTHPGREPDDLGMTKQRVFADRSGRYSGFEATLRPLPARVDVFYLELTWSIAACTTDSDCRSLPPATTLHTIVSLWKAPRPGVPLYKRTLVWSSRWAAGEWSTAPSDRRSVEAEISRRLLTGFGTLNDTDDRTYGGFDRPTYDGVVDGVDVFLDHKQCACGEFKHALMAMIEYQGIDAQWGVLQFDDRGPGRLSYYRTKTISALGREIKHWYHWNHAFVLVNDRVYDPTYGLEAESIAAFEDLLFAHYCQGEEGDCSDGSSYCYDPPDDLGRDCVVNPPGLAADFPFRFYRGDSYR